MRFIKSNFKVTLASLKATTVIEVARSVFFAAGIFIIAGSVAALWDNVVFIRMSPISGYEYPLLLIESSLAGLYLGLRAPSCAIKTAGSGGVLGFLGIACPICNKLLMLLFGGNLLLTYFEPIRPIVGMLGIGMLFVALWEKLVLRAESLRSREAVI